MDNEQWDNRLPERVRKALTAFQRALFTAFPGQIQHIILYGSYARGDAAPDSDVDVMIVVAWEEERLPDGFYRSMYGDPRWERIVDAAHDEAFLAKAREIVAEAVWPEGSGNVARSI